MNMILNLKRWKKLLNPKYIPAECNKTQENARRRRQAAKKNARFEES